jgi:hypothetical protein
MKGTVLIVNKDKGLIALQDASGEYTIVEVPHVGLEVGDMVSGEFNSEGSTILRNDTKDELLHVFIQEVNVTLEHVVEVLGKTETDNENEVNKTSDTPHESKEPAQSHSQDFEKKRKYIIELLMGCPFGSPLVDCPARDMRKFPIKEQMEILDDMSERDIDTIITYHKKCLRKRQGLLEQTVTRSINH